MFYPPCCPPLNVFQCIDVVGNKGVPDRAGIFKHRLHKCFLCYIFESFICGLDVASEEAQGLVGFVADIGDTGDIGDSAEE